MIFEDSRGKRPGEGGQLALGPGLRFFGSRKGKNELFFLDLPGAKSQKKRAACRKSL